MDAFPDPYRFEDELVDLLADASARAILRQLRAGERTVKQLATSVSLNARSVRRIVERAQLIGVVSSVGAYGKCVHDPAVHAFVGLVAGLPSGEASWLALGQPRALRVLRLLLDGPCFRSELNLLGPSARISEVLRALALARLAEQQHGLWDVPNGTYQHVEELVNFPPLITQTALHPVLRAAHQHAELEASPRVTSPTSAEAGASSWLPGLAELYRLSTDDHHRGELYPPRPADQYATDRHAAGPLVGRLHDAVQRSLSSHGPPRLAAGASHARLRAAERLKVLASHGAYAPASALRLPRIQFADGLAAAAVFTSGENALSVDLRAAQLHDAVLAVTTGLELPQAQRRQIGGHLAMRHALRLAEQILLNEQYTLALPEGTEPSATPDRLDYSATWTHEAIRNARRVVHQHLAVETS